MYCFFILSVLFLTGCGDNGSVANTSRVILSTQGSLPVGAALSGVDVTLQLPTGITPRLAADGTVDISVVKGSGVITGKAGIFTVTYTPASGTLPGTLNFVIYSTAVDGFGIGEFATVTMNKAAHEVDFAAVGQNMAAGTTLLVSTDYKVKSFSPRDLAGSIVNTINIALAVEAN